MPISANYIYSMKKGFCGQEGWENLHTITSVEANSPH